MIFTGLLWKFCDYDRYPALRKIQPDETDGTAFMVFILTNFQFFLIYISDHKYYACIILIHYAQNKHKIFMHIVKNQKTHIKIQNNHIIRLIKPYFML